MPCYDPGYRSDSSYNNGLTYEEQKKLNKIDKIEAQLCALLTELEKSNNLQIVKDAEKNGKVSIIEEFHKDHKVKDSNRIDALLNNLSQHEIDMLKEKLHKYK